MNVRFMERAVLGAAVVVLCLFTGSSSLGQLGPQKHEPKGPWENKGLSPDERADLVIEKMTLDEKSSFCMDWAGRLCSVHRQNPDQEQGPLDLPDSSPAFHGLGFPICR